MGNDTLLSVIASIPECTFAHDNSELRPRPQFDRADLAKLVDGINAIPGVKFRGCIHSCCGVDETSDVNKLCYCLKLQPYPN